MLRGGNVNGNVNGGSGCGDGAGDGLASMAELLLVHGAQHVSTLFAAGSSDADEAAAAREDLLGLSAALTADGAHRDLYVTPETSVAVRATAGMAARLAGQLVRG